MTLAVAAAAEQLVAGDSAARVAAGAAQACDQLTRHLARLVGELGTRTLLARSATLASRRFPWLDGAIPRTAPAEAPWGALRLAMSQQDPATARAAFVALLSTFVELLERLIGGALVERLLHELWPELIPPPTKGTP